MSFVLSYHALEPIAAISGLLNVYLAARINIWNWLFGILTVCFYLMIFFHVKLYADMCLQVVFLSLQFYGLKLWLVKKNGSKTDSLKKASSTALCVAVVAIGCLSCMISYVLQHYTDSTLIHLDAFITATSLVAQWMMSRKWLEHWWLWMIVDLFSIYLYWQKSLYWTVGLYGILFFTCILGFCVWRRRI